MNRRQLARQRLKEAEQELEEEKITFQKNFGRACVAVAVD